MIPPKEEKFMLSFAYSGRNEEEIETISFQLGFVMAHINQTCGYDSIRFENSMLYENYFKQTGMSNNEIYEFCLDFQKKCDFVVLYLDINVKSTGILKELNLSQELNQSLIMLNQKDIDFRGLYPEYDFKNLKEVLEWKGEPYDLESLLNLKEIIGNSNFFQNRRRK